MNGANFSDNLKQVVFNAETAAKKYGTTYVGSEHLVFGMLAAPESTAGKLLSEAGVQFKPYAEVFKRTLDHHAPITGFTPRTKKMFDLAEAFAKKASGFNALTGSEHLLLAVLSMSDCLAVSILRSLGVKIKTLIARTEDFVAPPAEDESGEEKPVGKITHGAEKIRTWSYAVQTREAAPMSEIDSELLQYGTDLTHRAREGKLDPVIGRQ